MELPGDATLYEGELATFWFDEEGILCAIAKSTLRTAEKQKTNYDFVRQITGNKKVCLLSDASNGSFQDNETRQVMTAQLPDLFKAMAVISRSALGKFNASIFMSLQHEPIPIRLFAEEKDAREWLRTYL